MFHHTVIRVGARAAGFTWDMLNSLLPFIAVIAVVAATAAMVLA